MGKEDFISKFKKEFNLEKYEKKGFKIITINTKPIVFNERLT